MSSSSPTRTYYPALDGLRGLAILLVVVYHNFGFIHYFFFGWLGVDLFFVLSGFLITNILLDTRGTPHYLRNFYARRTLRVFPIYYLTLIILLFLLPAVIRMPTDLEYYIDHHWWFWVYLENWLFIFNPPGQEQALNHFWSLAVEEQFYLIWPFVILIVKKPRALLALMVIMLVAVISIRFWLFVYDIKNLAYYNLYTFTRIDGICIGCIIALLYRINIQFLNKYTTSIVLSLAAMNFAFFFFNQENNFTFPYLAIVGYTTFAIMFGLLLHEAVQKKNKIVNKIFTFPLLQFFGKISYGFYVFHWPVFLCLGPLIRPLMYQILPADYAMLMTSLIATLIGLLLSILSYYTIERYFLGLKKNFNFKLFKTN